MPSFRHGARVLAAFALLLASVAPRAAPLEACSQPLSVGLYAIPPYHYRTPESPDWRGIDSELLSEITRRTGCRFDTRFESRVRIWQQIEAGTLDITVSGLHSAERERFARFIDYVSERNMVAVRASPAAPPLTAVLDDTHLTLAVTRGYRYGPPFDAWIARLAESGRVFETADEEAALRLVAIGRTGASIVRDSAWAIIAHPYPQGSLQLVDVDAPQINAGLVLSRARIGPQLYELLLATVTAMKRDGTLLRIAQRHMPADIARRSLPQDPPGTPERRESPLP